MRRRKFASLRPKMMDPFWLGRAVVRAHEPNEPYIVTHPEYHPGLEARQRLILAAFGEPAEAAYSTGAAATEG